MRIRLGYVVAIVLSALLAAATAEAQKKTLVIGLNQDPDILWNFEKFLVSRDGTIVRRFAPAMTPDDPVILDAIDAELAR